MAMSKTTGKTKTKAETRTRAVKSEAASVANEVPTSSSVVSKDAVADLAYQLFLQRGGQHGFDVDDWVAAERLLTVG
jgi:hypothetical protein